MRFRPIFALPLLWTLNAAAADDRPTGTKLTIEGPSAKLYVEVVGNEIVARACTQDPCPTSARLERIRVENGEEISLTPLAISPEQAVAWAHGPSFDAFLVAAGEPVQAKVLWAGETGLVDGVPGSRKGPLVQVTEPAEDGTVRILVGEQREDLSLCGRPAILSPRLLDPADLSWKPVRVHRLSPSERGQAQKLEARRAEAKPSLAPVLRARIATSAVGDPGALTDGDFETTWAEGRKGSGWGELVQLDVAKDVPITGLGFVLRPPKRKIPNGTAPSRFFLATSDALYAVTLPENAWSKPGASYEVSFDPPLRTECLAVVLDEAQGPARDEAEVTFAEITARTSLDEQLAHPEALVAELLGGGEVAKAARTLLQRGGEPAFLATAARFSDLDDAGRGLALEVLDVAPCRISAPVYLHVAITEPEGRAHHARDRLLRCGSEAAPALVSAIEKGPEPARLLAAKMLSLSAPDLAVPAIVHALPKTKSKSRAELRAALARAVQAPRADEAIRRLLDDENAPKDALLPLLRSLALRPELLVQAEATYERVLGAEPDFRTRYLLMETTARLAGAGASRPLETLRQTLLHEDNRYLRMRAAEVAEHVPSLGAELVGATRDPEPRVRLAAVMALAGQAQQQRTADGALDAVVERLRSDAWTFVRARAADALVAFPAGEATDQALGQALADAMPQVRARAVEAIKRRRAVSQAPLVRARLLDKREFVDVRARAARALGELCDVAAADELVRLAREGSRPMAHADAQVLAMASVAALGRLKPADLEKKLSPLLGEGTPHALQMAARAALANRDTCR